MMAFYVLAVLAVLFIAAVSFSVWYFVFRTKHVPSVPGPSSPGATSPPATTGATSPPATSTTPGADTDTPDNNDSNTTTTPVAVKSQSTRVYEDIVFGILIGLFVVGAVVVRVSKAANAINWFRSVFIVIGIPVTIWGHLNDNKMLLGLGIFFIVNSIFDYIYQRLRSRSRGVDNTEDAPEQNKGDDIDIGALLSRVFGADETDVVPEQPAGKKPVPNNKLPAKGERTAKTPKQSTTGDKSVSNSNTNNGKRKSVINTAKQVIAIPLNANRELLVDTRAEIGKITAELDKAKEKRNALKKKWKEAIDAEEKKAAKEIFLTANIASLRIARTLGEKHKSAEKIEATIASQERGRGG